MSLMGRLTLKLTDTTEEERKEFRKIGRNLMRSTKGPGYTRTYKGDGADWRTNNSPDWLKLDDWYIEIIIQKMTQHDVDVYKDLGYNCELVRVSRQQRRHSYKRI